MKIVADPNIPFVQEAFGPLGEVQLVPGREIAADTVRNADALLVRSVTPVNAALLDGSRVKFVATATIGFDHIDREYLSQKGIGFASAQGSNANSVAEYIVAVMLEIARREKYYLRNKTLGVIGVGNVGSRVVRYAQALGMQVLQNDPPRERVEGASQFASLERVITEADIITLHVPLTRKGPDPTFHLFGGLAFASLKRQPLLINTSRGAVVDNSELWLDFYHRRRTMRNVVLDVWENEPNISWELAKVIDIGTPHIAGYSFDGKVNGTRMIYRELCDFLSTTPDWDPTLPSAPMPNIEMTPLGNEDEEGVIRRAINCVYEISDDSKRLLSAYRLQIQNPFDRMRTEYPVRREFFNTEVVLRGASESLRTKFAALGFKMG